MACRALHSRRLAFPCDARKRPCRLIVEATEVENEMILTRAEGSHRRELGSCGRDDHQRGFTSEGQPVEEPHELGFRPLDVVEHDDQWPRASHQRQVVAPREEDLVSPVDQREHDQVRVRDEAGAVGDPGRQVLDRRAGHELSQR